MLNRLQSSLKQGAALVGSMLVRNAAAVDHETAHHFVESACHHISHTYHTLSKRLAAQPASSTLSIASSAEQPVKLTSAAVQGGALVSNSLFGGVNKRNGTAVNHTELSKVQEILTNRL